MDNDSIRVAVGLHLGSALCIPHDCALRGPQVDETGVHALSCRKSKGKLPHHSYLNDIIKRALTAIDIPCALEPVAYVGEMAGALMGSLSYPGNKVDA